MVRRSQHWSHSTWFLVTDFSFCTSPSVPPSQHHQVSTPPELSAHCSRAWVCMVGGLLSPSISLPYYSVFLTFTYLQVGAPWCPCMKTRGLLVRVSSFLLPCGFQRQNSDHLAWQQTPLPAGLSHWLALSFSAGAGAPNSCLHTWTVSILLIKPSHSLRRALMTKCSAAPWWEGVKFTYSLCSCVWSFRWLVPLPSSYVVVVPSAVG